MYKNINVCPEIEELKKAILIDPPEEFLNSNSNSKEKNSLLLKKEKDVALDFLRKFNEAQEKINLEKKRKETEDETNKLFFQQENEIYQQKMKENLEKQHKTENFIKPKEKKFNRIANLKDLEEFNIKNSLPFSQMQKIEFPVPNNKKRKISHNNIIKPQKHFKDEPKFKMKNTNNSQQIPKEFNKLKIEFKETKPLKQIEENFTIKEKPLIFYCNEERICRETENLSFRGEVKECERNDDIWLLEIQFKDPNAEENIYIKAIYNINLPPNLILSSNKIIKEIQIGKEYIFEYKSAPKKYKGKYLIFLEDIHIST